MICVFACSHLSDFLLSLSTIQQLLRKFVGVSKSHTGNIPLACKDRGEELRCMILSRRKFQTLILLL